MNHFPPVSKVVSSLPSSNGRFKEVFANFGQNGFLGQNFSHFQGMEDSLLSWWGWLKRVLNAMILHVVLNEKSLQRYLFRIKSGCHSLTNLQCHGIWSLVNIVTKTKGFFSCPSYHFQYLLLWPLKLVVEYGRWCGRPLESGGKGGRGGADGNDDKAEMVVKIVISLLNSNTVVTVLV